MAKRKPKQVFGTVTGKPGNQLLIGAETGVFKPRETRAYSGGTVTLLEYDFPANWLNKELDEATQDAEQVLRSYLGDNWKSERKKLNAIYLSTGLIQEYLTGGDRLPQVDGETKIKVMNQVVQKVRIDGLNRTLREQLTQQQIEQLLDAVELLTEILFIRHNPSDHPTEMRMRRCIKLGMLWQQMKMRDVEADAVRGKVTVQAAGAGGKAVAKLTDEQKRLVRAAAEEARQLGKKLGAVDARFATKFKVSAKTIERVRKEKPSDNPANV